MIKAIVQQKLGNIMKIKNILTGLLLLSSIIDASSRDLPEAGKSSSPKSMAAAAATTQGVTVDDLVGMQRYFKSTYYPLIENLREGNRVSRDDILNAYSRDPFLERGHDGGHGTFEHRKLPLKFCVIAHGNGDISSKNEFRGHHKALQVYANVIKLFFQPLLDMRRAITDLDTMSPQEWKQAHRTKFKDATQAFDAMIRADWSNLIDAQGAAFEKYSRD
jgi:hypothetical protein